MEADSRQGGRRNCACGAEISPTAERCVECLHKAWAEATEARRARIAEMWADGHSMAEIAEDIGTTRNALSGEMVRMRRAGWDLPFRRMNTPSAPVTRQQARSRLMTAIRNGQIRRPVRCERCGDEGRVDGHHTDYTRPLYVEWLCRSCHIAHHSAERKAA